MRLWTLGQQSKDTKNPIAGILQKELGITSQQGRKIIEQRQKIQSVCTNLKEVSLLIVLLNRIFPFLPDVVMTYDIFLLYVISR